MKTAGIDQRVLGGRYRLVRPIGSGVTGVVWMAKASGAGRRVAVRLLSETAVSSRPFLNKWEQLGGLCGRRPLHPAVAEVLFLGEDGRQRFVVAELVRTESLADRLRQQRRLPAEQAVRITAQVAKALEWAHRGGVVHGGIKPANVFIGNGDLVKVTDFAINQGLIADRPDLDQSIELAGCSPEQLAGLDTTPASDVYSLGVLLYRMLSGEFPFSGDSPNEVAWRHIRNRAPSLSMLGIEAPEYVLEACELALAKDPEARPAAATFLSLPRDTEWVKPVPIADVLASPEARATPAVRKEPAAASESMVEAAESATERLWAPARDSRRPRAIALGAIGALLLSAIIASVLLATGGGGAARTPTPHLTPSFSPNVGIEVPNLVGLSASRARELLLIAGLTVDRLVPLAGNPGVVVRTQPPPGEAIGPGTSVTLFVGVDPDRLRREREQSPSPG